MSPATVAPPLTLDSMFADLNAGVSAFVEERHGTSAGSEWRDDPIGWREFVESKDHLDLPPIYDGPQADAMDALLGADPKRMFEEPGAREPVPLAWARVRSSNVKGVGWARRLAVRVVQERRRLPLPRGVDRDVRAGAAREVEGQGDRRRDPRPQGLREARRRGPDDVRSVAAWDGRLYQVAVLLWGKGRARTT
jgi:hypothetical protein